MTDPTLNAAKKLPAPEPGLMIPRISIAVLHEYLELHGLEIERFYGGQIMVRKARADAGSMREVAENLAKVGD
jgi:hypothetical protein